MKSVKLAILGQGRSGWSIHGAHLLKDTERFQVVAVVDALPERRAKAAEAFGCDTYEDYTALFGRTDIDLVINALPSFLHPPVTIDLLEHGFNVLTEKPMARTAAQVDAMIDASVRSGKKLAVFQQSRFVPYFLKVKEVIASGKLGRIVQISISFDGYARRWDWQCLQENTGGNLYNTGPHPLDQALNLLDDVEHMPTVFCKMDRALTYGDAEDYVKLILTAPGKPLIDLSISSCNAYPTGIYNVQGTRGGLSGDAKSLKWRYFDPEKAQAQHLIRTPLTTADGEPAYCVETLPWQEESWSAQEHETAFNSAVRVFYDGLYAHLVHDEPLSVTPQVRQQIAVAELCHRMNPLSTLEKEAE
ncbi:MAG TPA: Gfo/Idh/MocA family oxidoreductase [Clostridia bacterium]|nr:Gfo/Idh/MocA family oxidoreductase [Clostridia bacterium]